MNSKRAIVSHDRFDDRARSYTPARVGLFNEANRRYPEVRSTERQLLIDRLDLKPGLTVCELIAILKRRLDYPDTAA